MGGNCLGGRIAVVVALRTNAVAWSGVEEIPLIRGGLSNDEKSNVKTAVRLYSLR